MKNCSLCGKPIVLVPSAAERAAKDCTGKSAAYYTSLFTVHAECELERRKQQVSDLMSRRRGENPTPRIPAHGLCP